MRSRARKEKSAAHAGERETARSWPNAYTYAPLALSCIAGQRPFAFPGQISRGRSRREHAIIPRCELISMRKYTRFGVFFLSSTEEERSFGSLEGEESKGVYNWR